MTNTTRKKITLIVVVDSTVGSKNTKTNVVIISALKPIEMEWVRVDLTSAQVWLRTRKQKHIARVCTPDFAPERNLNIAAPSVLGELNPTNSNKQT